MRINLKVVQRVRYPKRIEQIKWYIDEIDNNTKQFARELNELPMNKDDHNNIMLQDIITKI